MTRPGGPRRLWTYVEPPPLRRRRLQMTVDWWGGLAVDCARAGETAGALYAQRRAAAAHLVLLDLDACNAGAAPT